jgi:hypothetical protein
MASPMAMYPVFPNACEGEELRYTVDQYSVVDRISFVAEFYVIKQQFLLTLGNLAFFEE